MKRILSTALAISLLLGLGALAIIASPNGAGSLLPAARPAAVALAASNFQGAAAPQAPDAAQNFNMIAMPLDATSQFTNAGYTFDAKGLAALAGSGVIQVLHWDAASQIYETWNTDFGGYGTNFSLAVGGVYWLLLDVNAKSIISFVGDVPNAGTVHFTFVNGAACQFNEFSLPLDKSQIINAQQLAAAIGSGVVQVAEWDATNQIYATWNTDFGGYGTNFTTKIGYPYAVCLTTGAPTTWP